MEYSIRCDNGVMSHARRDRRLVPVPAEIRGFVAELVEELGPKGAATRLGCGRDTALSVALGRDVMPGTRALLLEAFRRDAA